jgi:hypothetical protein
MPGEVKSARQGCLRRRVSVINFLHVSRQTTDCRHTTATKEFRMNNICIVIAVALLVAFSAVNLFIPYALLALALFIPLGFACRVISRARKQECRLGFC